MATKPALRIGYMVGTGVDLRQFTVLPSFLVDYYWSKDLSFEVEVGAQWTNSVQFGTKSNDVELLATIGVRYDVYSDTSTKAESKSCAGIAHAPTAAVARRLSQASARMRDMGRFVHKSGLILGHHRRAGSPRPVRNRGLLSFIKTNGCIP